MPLKIVRNVADLRSSLFGTVGFVPTMGALHEGHLELMRRAKVENDCCVASLFVNPAQFGPNEDFSRYPRQEEQDAALVESVGGDVLFVPSVDEVYKGNDIKVTVGDLASRYEGAFRPGHFDGVATVVTKLFGMVGRSTSYFGLKDLQQCAVVNAITEAMFLPVKLVFIDTIREADGLAMSSRNMYLALDERQQATQLNLELSKAKQRLIQNSEDVAALSEGLSALINSGWAMDYFALVDRYSFNPENARSEDSAIIAAGKLGKVRLIDNVTF